MTIERGGQVTVIEKEVVACVPILSVTFIPTVDAPTVVGVPLIIPALDNVSPAGKEPDAIDQVYGVVPPIATICCE